MRTCVPGCIRDSDHDGRCYQRRTRVKPTTTNPWAEASQVARAGRMARAEREPVQPGTRAVVANLALREAALAVAAADLAYEKALHGDGGTIEAREVLRRQCVPARRAYRAALDAAAMEDAA